MSFYSKYRGRSVGRIIHFLSHYCHNVYDQCTIGHEKVLLWGKSLATFSWDEGFGLGDVPVFVFSPCREYYAYCQSTMRERAISDGCRWSVPADGRESVGRDAVRILLPKDWSRIDLYSQSVHGVRPAFFTRKDSDHEHRLYAEANGWVYAWDSECGWLLWVEGEKPVEKAAE